MIVTDSILEAGRRPIRFDTPDESPVGEGREGVIDSLARDDADLGPYDLIYVVRRAMWPVGHRLQNCQTLDGDPYAAPAEEGCLIKGCFDGRIHNLGGA